MNRLTKITSAIAFVVAAGAGLFAAPTDATALCLSPQLQSGTYRNVDPDTRGITTVRIGRFRCGDTVRNGVVDPTGFPIEMWGQCRPRDCRFPSFFARKHGRTDAFRGMIEQDFATRRVRIFPDGPSTIGVVMQTRFRSPGRADYTAVYRLRAE